MVRLYTHNIRYARSPPVEGELEWSKRREGVVNSIVLHNCSIACLQEVLWTQLEDVLKLLGSEWDYAGVGRDDGKKKGEFAVILYKKALWKVNWLPFWLSPTPSKPSIGWDAALKRIVIQAHFQSKTDSSKRFVLYCTHFDHKGETARQESAKLIVRLMKDQWGPQILCGDLNSQPEQIASQTLREFLEDSFDCDRKFGHKHTYTSFSDEPHTRIDYIWHTNDIETEFYAVPHSHYGFFISDHRPVIADLVLPEH